MKTSITSNKTLTQTGFGVTGALLTGAYTLCTCVVTGRGLLSFLLCCVLCFFLSAKSQNGIFAPHPFLLLPLFLSLSGGSALASGIAIACGGLFYLLLSKLLDKKNIPDFLVSGMGLGITVGVTILLTNSYFGIGANSFTPLDMLKEFRSLGFHPNFRGLFYGTITLFAMITYPFKFKKLNQYLPAAFVTLLIPYIFNLFLNPHRELTTINESSSLFFADSLQNEFSDFLEISKNDIPFITKSAIGFGFILFVYDRQKTDTCPANCLCGILSGMPLKKHPIKEYGIISAGVSTVIIALAVFLCPGVFSRLPLHCAGSMLIVSAWQNLPFSSLKNVFKERNPLKILLMIVCAVLFVVTDLLTAVLICFVLLTISDKTLGKEHAK